MLDLLRRVTHKERRVTGHFWPKFAQGETIGMAEEGVKLPKDFEKRTTIKDLEHPASIYLPDEVLNARPGSAIKVFGRSPGKYVLTMSDQGDPFVLVNRVIVENNGFNPDAFNWEKAKK